LRDAGPWRGTLGPIRILRGDVWVDIRTPEQEEEATMRRFLVIGLLTVAVAVVAIAPSALASDPDSSRRNVRADLSGFHETPNISTTGFGELTAVVEDNLITYTLTYAALETNATQAHIHFGYRHIAGGVSAFLCGGGDKPPCPLIAGTVTGTIDPADVVGPASQGIEPGSMVELVRAIRAGHTYANVHTTRFPAGEIRGQIADEDQREVQP
jgi:hypothetical protein